MRVNLISVGDVEVARVGEKLQSPEVGKRQFQVETQMKAVAKNINVVVREGLAVQLTVSLDE